jgi:cell division protein FtsB
MTRRNQSQRVVARRRRTSRVLAGLVAGSLLIVLVANFFFDEMGIRKDLAMREHARQLEQELQDLRQANTELRGEIERVQHDPVRIEELARERLGYVRKGETVYQIAPDPPDPTMQAHKR